MTEPLERLRTALADRYDIQRELGHGGMAVVYLADDLRHERKVALKVLKPELSTIIGGELRKMFGVPGRSGGCGAVSQLMSYTLARRREGAPMASNGDSKGGNTAVDRRPFVVARPCPVCDGEGNISEQACATCHGTGVGRFFHGTKADLKSGNLIEPGHPANFGKRDRTTAYVYLTGTLDAAVWGAELSFGEGLGRIYMVEPTGPIEDDPNLTDKRYPGNPTKSYRSREPLRVVGEIMEWQGHSPDDLKAMKDGLERLEKQGVQPIED